MSSVGDLLQSVGGKINLNSAFNINMMMILGVYRFCISNAAYNLLARNTEYNWQAAVQGWNTSS